MIGSVSAIAVVTCLALGLVKRSRQWVQDIPGSRSTHESGKPTAVGIVLTVIMLLSVVLMLDSTYINTISCICLVLSALGFVDDCVNLRQSIRLAVQLLTVLYVLWQFPPVEEGHFVDWLPVSVIWIAYLIGWLWSINAFNFMDGADGQAATQMLSFLLTAVFFFVSVGDKDMAVFLIVVSVICAVYLFWNLPNAMMFMGDAGSLVYGFLVAAVAYYGEQRWQIPMTSWIVLHGFFCFDATVTLLRRLFAGDRFLQPHLLHAFHRIRCASVLTDSQALLIQASINVVLAGFAIAIWCYSDLSVVFTVMATIFMLMYYMWIERLAPMYPKKN